MRLSRLLTTAAIAATLATSATAQCFQFANTPPGSQFAIADDAVRTFGLPFLFPFHGVNYDRITVCSNGFVWFGTGPITGANDLSDTTAEMLSQPARVAVCWDDWDTDNFAVIPPGGGVFFSADATQCSVVWKGIPRFGSTTVFANMECVLTASGGIHLYFDSTMGVSTSTCITGTSRGPGAVASLVNWSPTLPGSVLDSTAYESFTANTGLQPFDLANSTLNLVPNTPPNGVPPIAYTPNNTANPTCVPYAFLPAIATTPTSTGAGCPSALASGSLYELFTIGTGVNPIDLANTAIRFTRTGDTYTTGVGTFDANYAATGTIQTGVTDDSLHVHALASTFAFGATPVTTVTMSTNGFLWLGTSTTQAFNATAAAFHTGALPRIAGYWKDLSPNTTTAPIYVENTATKFQATWHNVPLFTGAGTQTIQISMDHATGDITLGYLGLTGTVTSNPPLVGIAGVSSANLGSSDLATAGIANVVGPRTATSIIPLAHGSTAAQIGLPLSLTFTNAPVSNIGFGIVILGDQALSVTLDSIFGAGQAPGCSVYTNLLSDFPLAFTAGATSGGITVPVPYDIYMTGVTLNSQIAILAPVNALGLVSSNARQWTVGL